MVFDVVEPYEKFTHLFVWNYIALVALFLYACYFRRGIWNLCLILYASLDLH